ncbi:MAG TPA: glycosyltransferase [Gemmatimonadales bacterium]|nr:glycosyltransferase [Gemmatimonadales bacterium]
MRVAVVGAGSPLKTEASITRACRSLGCETLHLNVPGSSQWLGPLAPPFLWRRVAGFRPDIVILTVRAIRLGEHYLARIAEQFPTAFWYFDYLLTNDAVRVARLAETTFVSSTQHVGHLEGAGVGRVLFMPQGVDPEVDRPPDEIPDSFRCEVSFIGSGQYQARHEPLRRIAASARLQVRGPGWTPAPPGIPVGGGETRGVPFTQATAGAAICLGLHAYPEQALGGYSSSNRMWKVLGAGGFFLGEHSAGIEAFARDGVHCVWFHSPDEMMARISHFLGRPDERKAIAAMGRTHALAKHTYAHRLQLMLRGKGYETPGENSGL